LALFDVISLETGRKQKIDLRRLRSYNGLDDTSAKVTDEQPHFPDRTHAAFALLTADGH
jgi:hypothetical protein